MKKLIFLLLLIPSLVFSASAYRAPTDDSQQLVSVDQFPRVLHFDENRNTYTIEGQILVCMLPVLDGRHSTTCEISGKTQWADMLSLVIPGYVISAYSYRYVGAHGRRQLLVYLKKK